MTLSDFLTSLELELRLRAVPFDCGEQETWAADVCSLAEDDPDVIRWAEAFLAARQDVRGRAIPRLPPPATSQPVNRSTGPGRFFA